MTHLAESGVFIEVSVLIGEPLGEQQLCTAALLLVLHLLNLYFSSSFGSFHLTPSSCISFRNIITFLVPFLPLPLQWSVTFSLSFPLHLTLLPSFRPALTFHALSLPSPSWFSPIQLSLLGFSSGLYLNPFISSFCFNWFSLKSHNSFCNTMLVAIFLWPFCFLHNIWKTLFNKNKDPALLEEMPIPCCF